MKQVDVQFDEAKKMAAQVQKSLQYCKETFTQIEEKNKHEIKVQGTLIMDAVASFESEEPLDEAARQTRDEFRKVHAQILQDRQEAEKEFTQMNQQTKLQEIRQALELDRSQQDQ